MKIEISSRKQFLTYAVFCLLCAPAIAQVTDKANEADAKPANVEVLSDMRGVNFAPYLKKLVKGVRMKWYDLIPESARSPQMKSGAVSIEFSISKDGTLNANSMLIRSSSGDDALDHAAWEAIKEASPFKKMPHKFSGQGIMLRFHFFYNPGAKKTE